MLSVAGSTVGGHRRRVVVAAAVALLLSAGAGAAHAHAAGACFQKVEFYNESGYVVSKFALTDPSGDVWTSPNQYALAQSVTVDLTALGLKDDARLGTYITVTGRGDRTTGPEIRYCRNSQAVGVKAYGTVFSPQLATY